MGGYATLTAYGRSGFVRKVRVQGPKGFAAALYRGWGEKIVMVIAGAACGRPPKNTGIYRRAVG